MKKRIDILLLEKSLANSRTQAKNLISLGHVLCNGQLVKKGSVLVDESVELKVIGDDPYVGRGALKLLNAIESFDLKFDDKIVADLGASTGGFTEIALEKGAKKVFAVDVGHDQLAEKLLNNDRVVNIEGHNLRDPLTLDVKCDLVVADLSFISLKLVLSNMIKLMNPSSELVLLFKPQFEVGRSSIGKNGVVKDQEKIKASIESFYNFCIDLELNLIKIAPCQVKGKLGNQEFFCLARLDQKAVNLENLKSWQLEGLLK